MLDIYLPDSNEFSVFVYFHGGGIEHQGKGWQEMNVEYICGKNIALVSAGYRVYPHARYPEFIMDASNAKTYL